MQTRHNGNTRPANNQNYNQQTVVSNVLAALMRTNENASASQRLLQGGTELIMPDSDQNNTNALASLCTGTVKYANVYSGQYIVLLDNHTGETICTDNTGRGLPFSTSKAAPYPPNARVVVYYLNQAPGGMGIILGTIPDLASRARLFSAKPRYANINHLWARIGVRKDDYPKTYTLEFPFRHYGDARPIDSTGLGDLTYSNFTGGLIHMNMWQQVLKVSNGCGIWQNLIDELMRQVAKNWQVWTPAGHFNKYTACGETLNYGGQALYDWEGLGVLRKPGRKGEEWISVDTDRTMDTQKLYTAAECGEGDDIKEKLSPFFRFEQFGGWLGHGGMTSVRSYPKQPNELYEMHRERETSQLYRQSLNVSGAFSLQAAGGFSLERTIVVPCYQNCCEQFEDEGDSGDNGYEYTGKEGDKTETLKVQNANDPITDPLVRAVGVDDYYIREKYKSLYAFAHHKKDYQRVEPQLTIDQLKPYAQQLKNKQLMPKLNTTTANAEIFWKDVDYTIRKSGIYATQDGGFLIRDAYGNEIRTGVNGIEIDSIGDITFKAQRRVVSMSGDDTVITANKSMDLTAVQNDMRLAAYHNMEIVGAVSSSGRTLIENRGMQKFDAYVEKEEFGEDIKKDGLYLVAKDTSTIHYTKDIYTKCLDEGFYDYGTSCWCWAGQTYEIKAMMESLLITGPHSKQSQAATSGVVVEANKEGGRITNLKKTHIKDDFIVHKSIDVKQGIKYEGGITGCGNICIQGSGCATGGFSFLPCFAGQACCRAAKASITANIAANADRQLFNSDLLHPKVQPLYQMQEVGHETTFQYKAFKSRDQDQYGTEEYVFVMPQYIEEFGGKIDEFKLKQFHEKFRSKVPNNEAESAWPGKTRWDQACCVVPKSVYADVKNKGYELDPNDPDGNNDKDIKENTPEDEYAIDNQNEVENYETPELKEPVEVFSATVIS